MAEAPVDPRSLIVYETRKKKNCSKSTPGTPILESDIVPLQEEHVERVPSVRCARNARTIPDDDNSEDELSRPSDYEVPTRTAEPAEENGTMMTTNLEDSLWANQ